MKIEVGGGCFIALVVFFFISGLIAMLQSQFGIGIMMIAGGAVGLVRYVLNQPNKIENVDTAPLLKKKDNINSNANQQTIETNNTSKQSLYKPYNIIWIEADGSEKIPLLFDEDDIKNFKLGTPFKYDQTQLFAALIFIYGSPAYRNELSNEEIESLIIKTVTDSTHSQKSKSNEELDDILFEVCEEVMEGCGSAFSVDFMIVYNVGAFKLTGNSIFRKNATIDLYNIIQSEKSESSMRLDSASVLFNTASFEVNLNSNKIIFKDKRMEYAVNVVLNESVNSGLPDFNSEEKSMLMENIKLIYLKHYEK